jgi:prolyl oligopeptidase
MSETAEDLRDPAPRAEPRPVQVDVCGVVYEDAFTWLEEDSEESLAWQAAQNAVAERALREVQGFDDLKRALEAHVGSTFVSAPHGRGDRWIRLAHGEGGERLERASGPAGPWRPILRSDDFSDPGRTASLDWFFPSPDGRYVAFGISWGGDEQCVLRLLDVDREEVLPVAVPDTWFSRVAWLPDSSGCFFPAGEYVMKDYPRDLLFLDVASGEIKRDVLRDLGFESEAMQEKAAYPQVSADGRWLTLASECQGGRIMLARRLPDGEWFEVLEGAQSTRAYGFVHGGDYVTVTTEDAPRGRLVRIPLVTGHDRTTWTELLPESAEVLVSVDLVAGHYVVCSLADATARVRVYDRDLHLVDELPLPASGVVAEHAMSANYKVMPPMEGGSVVVCGDAFTFTFAAPGRSPGTYLYDVPGRELRSLEPPALVLDGVVDELRWTAAPDGWEVPYTLVRRDDVDLSRPQPTLLFGYGGFGIAFVPTYLGKLAPFVEAGGVVVILHLRGGGEFGVRQWEDGRLERKQHTFDDLFAVAEALIADGVTATPQLGLVGESNGGALTAAALAQRPELWGAVCVQVPITDVLSPALDAFGLGATVSDYGDPRSPEGARSLMRWSPCQNLREAPYPPVLVWTGENDARCQPWHARKLVARLQHLNRADTPILLRARADGGHLSVGTDPDQVAEWLGFLMSRLGLVLPAEA